MSVVGCQSSVLTIIKSGTIFRFRWALLVLLVLAVPVLAQDGEVMPDAAHSWMAFFQHDTDDEQPRLIFIDTVTGEERPMIVSGERFTPLADSILYFDLTSGRVKLANPERGIYDHPFIQPGGDTRRVDWLVDAERGRIVWTLTSGDPAALVTTTTIANLDGTNPRQIWVDGPRNGLRALPVAFSPDGSTLYLDFQPDGISDLTPFQQYAALVGLDIESGAWDYLPGEPGCFCGAGFGSGLLLRLGLTADLSGFDLQVHTLPGGLEQIIPALDLPGYTQGGDFLVSPDASRAVYLLGQIKDFGQPDQSLRTRLITVNLQTMTQTDFALPTGTLLRPIAWTEDHSTVLLVARQSDGTWKFDLNDQTLEQVSSAAYLGTLQANGE
ncbi:MAG: hypothetical protein H6672_03975 [Anaerolineaceae bacterium]|nr:hypothetical protein [Anaerolineaceae bacterium]